ncbi:uncharacterized protein LOC111408440 [Olea europaea var. sylvestris]|uniref:uncharacterized protein LOC111408440 n=1 Tax=Olea europaea var. sylvestris TaxID=158386 RepID=UPI000C1D56FF|nr:uncharacterized protein LOC111408440 [Olea europaea var. sylvestris]
MSQEKDHYPCVSTASGKQTEASIESEGDGKVSRDLTDKRAPEDTSKRENYEANTLSQCRKSKASGDTSMVDGSFGPIHNTVETSKHSSDQVKPIETEERYYDFYQLRRRKHMKYDRKTSSADSACSDDT